MPDKFENATLRAKTEQMFCVHTRACGLLGGCLLSKFQTIIFFAMLITWEDKLHDKMTSAYSKSCGYKKFSVHTNTKKYRFQIVPLWRAFSKSSVFVDLFMRTSVDGSRIRNNKVAFSNLSGIVWTGPKMFWTNWQLVVVSIAILLPIRSLHVSSHASEICQIWRLRER